MLVGDKLCYKGPSWENISDEQLVVLAVTAMLCLPWNKYIYIKYINILSIYKLSTFWKNTSDRANNSCLEKQNDSHVATTVFSF